MQIVATEIEAQRAFRGLLQAMSHPGRVYALNQAGAGCDGQSALMTLLPSLLDHEVSFTVIDAKTTSTLEPLIVDRTGSCKAPLAKADFIVIANGDSGGRILSAKRGTLRYPDQSATLVYLVEPLLLSENAEPQVALKGPGIREEILLPALPGLAPRELAYLKEANAEFPLGVDALFLDKAGRILCIPRSTTIRIMEH